MNRLLGQIGEFMDVNVEFDVVGTLEKGAGASY